MALDVPPTAELPPAGELATTPPEDTTALLPPVGVLLELTTLLFPPEPAGSLFWMELVPPPLPPVASESESDPHPQTP
jgi:hypothetical protein